MKQYNHWDYKTKTISGGIIYHHKTRKDAIIVYPKEGVIRLYKNIITFKDLDHKSENDYFPIFFDDFLERIKK